MTDVQFTTLLAAFFQEMSLEDGTGCVEQALNFQRKVKKELIELKHSGNISKTDVEGIMEDEQS